MYGFCESSTNWGRKGEYEINRYLGKKLISLEWRGKVGDTEAQKMFLLSEHLRYFPVQF